MKLVAFYSLVDSLYMSRLATRVFVRKFFWVGPYIVDSCSSDAGATSLNRQCLSLDVAAERVLRVQWTCGVVTVRQVAAQSKLAGAFSICPQHDLYFFHNDSWQHDNNRTRNTRTSDSTVRDSFQCTHLYKGAITEDLRSSPQVKQCPSPTFGAALYCEGVLNTGFKLRWAEAIRLTQVRQLWCNVMYTKVLFESLQIPYLSVASLVLLLLKLNYNF
jgi:hypothetical protein